MKLLDIDWRAFFKALDLYRTLPNGARRLFVEQVRPSQAMPISVIGEWREPLVNSGLMIPGLTGVNFSVALEYREFSRAIRFMARSGVMKTPSRASFQEYAGDNLDASEVVALRGNAGFWRLDEYAWDKIFVTVCSASWPRDFLSATSNKDWESPYRDSQPPFFFAPAVFRAAQVLLRTLANEDEPVLFSRLPAMASVAGEMPFEVFSPALRALIRYLLVFPAVRVNDFEPLIGLWPGLGRKLTGRTPPPPPAVEVTEDFHSPFLVEDMVVILSLCAVEPIRLRTADMSIFEAARKSLADMLASLPEWFESLYYGMDERIAVAVDFLKNYGLAAQGGRPGADFRLEITEKGVNWLSLPAKQRLRHILDGLLRPSQREASVTNHRHLPLVPNLWPLGAHREYDRLNSAVLAGFAGLQPGVFIRMADHLNYQARTNNALQQMPVKDRYVNLMFTDSVGSASSDDELEGAWKNALHVFLQQRLMPLGGVRIGIEAAGRAVCFAITDVGRYMVGTGKDFELPGDAEVRILVQPNFDVVFLAPSARMEAELARFGERKGKRVGTLFRITKQSIFAAAAAGLTHQRILEILREYCPAGIPSNVQSEITGWGKRYRQIAVRPALIVNCPDAETTAKVKAALGKKAVKLSETSLEVHETKFPPAVSKKLREAGIFVRA